MPERHDTAGKALRINLSRDRYGTFAEIGGGQEVSRWFFRVGGAAGTVAKTMSAYDMTVGDAIYGPADRYVSRDRLRSMLEREYELLVQRLAGQRGKNTAFFVFADTVATRSFKGDNECHGWLGLRFQPAPGDRPSDILLHVALREPSAQRQQESLGILGVNLLHAAFYEAGTRRRLLGTLLERLTLDQIEIDVAELHGPAFAGRNDAPGVAADLVSLGLARAVLINESGRLDQPSTVLRKRAVLAYRVREGSISPVAAGAIRAAVKRLAAPEDGTRGPLALIEVSLRVGDGKPLRANAAREVAGLCRPGRATMVTAFRQAYELTAFLRRSTDGPLRFLIGLDRAVHALWEGCYRDVDGGLLEALGRTLAAKTRIEVIPVARKEFERRLSALGISRAFCTYPEKAVLSLGDIRLRSPAGRLLEYLAEAGWIVAAEPGGHASGRVRRSAGRPSGRAGRRRG